MPRILLADDDLTQLHLQQQVLEAAGHQVDVAPTPSLTLRHVMRSAPDLVIMDLRFPDGSALPDAREGLLLIRRIRELGCHAPVIVLSGWPDDLHGQPEEGMVSHVMVKPVKMRVLLAAIGELVG
ncbi:MAG: response regulator [Acidobacteriia bacterium]|nr:response regulator [Terriglobia bacterium]